MTVNGLLLCDDLLFASRVTATARAQGLSMVQLRDPAAILSRAIEDRPTAVLLDIHVGGLEIDALVRELKALTPPPRIIAFGSHVMTQDLAAARAAGCDFVLPRSAFAAQVEEQLRTWLTPS